MLDDADAKMRAMKRNAIITASLSRAAMQARQLASWRALFHFSLGCKNAERHSSVPAGRHHRAAHISDFERGLYEKLRAISRRALHAPMMPPAPPSSAAASHIRFARDCDEPRRRAYYLPASEAPISPLSAGN